jgi:cyanophycinase
MSVLGASRRRMARSSLRPHLESLEGRLCLSTVGLQPLPLSPAIELATTPSAAPATSSAIAKSAGSSGSSGYVYTRLGNQNDVSLTGEKGGLALEGGGTDIDSVFTWMGGRMGGRGDFLVIRATNDSAYNSYIYNMGGFNSVATLDIPSLSAANDTAVKAIIEKADAVFIGGGNQADYVNYWKNTPVQQAIKDDVLRGVPLGGTSAGTDVIGQFIYSAEGRSITSSEALKNPFDSAVTLDENFVDPSLVPGLNNTLVDTHFVTRDRMGRMAAFLARIDTNGWSSNSMPRGIGINEQTALEIVPPRPNTSGDWQATVVANTSNPQPYAYFLQTPGAPQVCQNKTPLTYYPISVTRVAAGGSFDLSTWVASGFYSQYQISAIKGVLSSTQAGGAIY